MPWQRLFEVASQGEPEPERGIWETIKKRNVTLLNSSNLMEVGIDSMWRRTPLKLPLLMFLMQSLCCRKAAFLSTLQTVLHCTFDSSGCVIVPNPGDPTLTLLPVTSIWSVRLETAARTPRRALSEETMFRLIWGVGFFGFQTRIRVCRESKRCFIASNIKMFSCAAVESTLYLMFILEQGKICTGRKSDPHLPHDGFDSLLYPRPFCCSGVNLQVLYCCWASSLLSSVFRCTSSMKSCPVSSGLVAW